MKKQIFRFTPGSKKPPTTPADASTAPEEPLVDVASVKIIAEYERRERERAEEKRRCDQEALQEQKKPAEEASLQNWLEYYRLEEKKKADAHAAPQSDL
jgi:hypothetical protein